jgi:hypothetical protein
MFPSVFLFLFLSSLQVYIVVARMEDQENINRRVQDQAHLFQASDDLKIDPHFESSLRLTRSSRKHHVFTTQLQRILCYTRTSTGSHLNSDRISQVLFRPLTAAAIPAYTRDESIKLW